MFIVKQLAVFPPKVFSFLKRLPRGQVITYSNLAAACGVPTARNIGWILHQNTDPDGIPCYKVVRSDGRLTDGYKFGGKAEQKRRLEADGVVFVGERIVASCLYMKIPPTR